RVRGAELALRIGERTHHVLLVARRRLQRRRGLAECKTPRLVLERLGGGAGRAADTGGAGERDALPEQGAAIGQAVARDGLGRGRASSASGSAHDAPP